MLKKIVWTFCVACSLSAVLGLMWLLQLYADLPDVESLRTVRLQVPLRVYTQDGLLIGEFGEMRREPVQLQAVPEQLVQAFLATEDARFYYHQGVDFIGMVRAAWHVVRSGTKGQGGSTITMQVARNFFLNAEKTYARKLREVLLAWKIEKELHKDEILTLYLNKIYLGNRAYGVVAAAHIYYGKKLSELSLDEMAMLAGLPKAPSQINPLVAPHAARERRNHVLARMHSFSYISDEDWKKASAVPVHAQYHGLAPELQAPYVAEMVRHSMVQAFGLAAYTAGYRVYTTIDSRLQRTAQEVVTRYTQKALHRNPSKSMEKPQAALVALDPQTGGILSLVGGTDYGQSKFNRVIQAKRQPGSSFKPFIYSAALERGFTPASLVNDAPIEFEIPGQKEPWRPRNDNRKFYGPTRLRVALSKSRNLVSIRLLQSIGIPYAVQYLKGFGWDDEALPPNLSMALGTGSVTPLSMARAFAVFANGGYLPTPHIIARVEDAVHQTVPWPPESTDTAVQSHAQKKRVISPQNAYLMTHMLQDAIRSGTGQLALRLSRSDLAGKTGTTNDQLDNWYVGYHPSVVTATWMGYDTPQSLRSWASQTALPMWVDFMEAALKGVPDLPWPEPPGLVTVKIDPHTGFLSRPDQKDAIDEIFYEHTVPKAPVADWSDWEEEWDNNEAEHTAADPTSETEEAWW